MNATQHRAKLAQLFTQVNKEVEQLEETVAWCSSTDLVRAYTTAIVIATQARRSLGYARAALDSVED